MAAEQMSIDAEMVYQRLYRYCEQREFAGHDPFDGLSSRLLQWSPLKWIAPARLAWLQVIKRSPVDLRSMLLVPAGVNPKALALFALAEQSRYRATNNDTHKQNADTLVARLLTLASESVSKNGKPMLSFGYNFDWQSRAFYAPKGTPTIVPTAFAARAFMEQHRLFGDETALQAVEKICEFIVSDLNRPHETAEEICFSYTPGDDSQIYNASMLAAEVLAVYGNAVANAEYLALAERAARFVINRQREDGAWLYGPKLRHAWVDNFHTAFDLDSLYRIASVAEGIRDEAKVSIRRGYEYWVNTFFLEDGAPKYFDTQPYPIDIHSSASAIATLSLLSAVDPAAMPLAERVLEWTATNLYDEEGGYFYYQKKASSTVKTPFMRWGEAWMAYALASFLEARS
jgi:hypothetical protein